jgi:AcrR family transcriptional regulator
VSSPAVQVDRAGAVRAALRRLVARSGFHGASMNAVAKEAGVATGTAYVHYASKDELVIAAYVETKRALGEAATRDLDTGAEPQRQFVALWLAVHAHMAAHADDARFLLQVEHSPYAHAAHEAAHAQGEDALLAVAAAPQIARLLAPLPLEVLWELGVAPAVRLAATGVELTQEQLEATAQACWRAVTRPPRG